MRVLSGGERRRLALAVVVASGANFLVLDEPTNHLDLESREALESALENFPATVLLVSHDRALLDAVAERTLAIEDGTIRSYDGGWADYVQNEPPAARKPVRRTCLPSRSSPVRHESFAQSARTERPHGARAGRDRDPASGGTVAELERKLADDGWDDMDLLTAHRAARAELQSLLDRWETLFEQAQALA